MARILISLMLPLSPLNVITRILADLRKADALIRCGAFVTAAQYRLARGETPLAWAYAASAASWNVICLRANYGDLQQIVLFVNCTFAPDSFAFCLLQPAHKPVVQVSPLIHKAVGQRPRCRCTINWMPRTPASLRVSVPVASRLCFPQIIRPANRDRMIVDQISHVRLAAGSFWRIRVIMNSRVCGDCCR